MKTKFLFLLLVLLSGVPAAYAVTPDEVLGKAVAKINKSNSVDCRFTISGSNGSLNGSLSASGRKFRMTTPMGTTWFDGSNMWTSNAKTKEITLVCPTDGEVRESNPFSYLESYKSQYRLFFSKRKDATRHLVLLNPKSARSDIKAVEVAVNKKTFMPERFIIRDRNNNVTTINIQSLSLTSAPQVTFVCPVDKMKDYELIDLR